MASTIGLLSAKASRHAIFDVTFLAPTTPGSLVLASTLYTPPSVYTTSSGAPAMILELDATTFVDLEFTTQKYGVHGEQIGLFHSGSLTLYLFLSLSMTGNTSIGTMPP